MNIIQNFTPTLATIQELPISAGKLGVATAGLYVSVQLLTNMNPAGFALSFAVTNIVNGIALKILNNVYPTQITDEKKKYVKITSSVIGNIAARPVGFGIDKPFSITSIFQLVILGIIIDQFQKFYDYLLKTQLSPTSPGAGG